jgi:hypothetical protein
MSDGTFRFLGLFPLFPPGTLPYCYPNGDEDIHDAFVPFGWDSNPPSYDSTVSGLNETCRVWWMLKSFTVYHKVLIRNYDIIDNEPTVRDETEREFELLQEFPRPVDKMCSSFALTGYGVSSPVFKNGSFVLFLSIDLETTGSNITGEWPITLSTRDLTGAENYKSRIAVEDNNFAAHVYLHGYVAPFYGSVEPVELLEAEIRDVTYWE